jgi:hypothetical protein
MSRKKKEHLSRKALSNYRGSGEMAKNKRSSDSYDDDDDINKAIREFKNGEQSEPPQEPPADEQASVEEPPAGEETVVEDEVPLGEFICSCCGKEWTLRRGREARKPGCSCPIRGLCRCGCGHCTSHCASKKVVNE